MANSPGSNQSEYIFFEERIRQARLSFNLSVCFACVSATATIVGIVLLLTGHLSKGSYAALGGITSTAVGHRCVQLSREANDRLDRNQQAKLKLTKE